MTLDEWIDTQLQRSKKFMEQGISATHLRKERKHFGYAVTPARGSVLASPVPASWDPDPDYFFHWLRDSALVMDAVTTLARDAKTPGERAHWLNHFRDFTAFSLKLSDIDGAKFLAAHNIRAATDPAFRQYLRDERELSALKDEAIPGEPRFNPDGTPDFQKWSRPQHDGAALRAVVCMRHGMICGSFDELEELIMQDLIYTVQYADEPCVGLWEEDNDQHYYTVLAQFGALQQGEKWARAHRHHTVANFCAAAARTLEKSLEKHWSAQHGVYLSARNKAPAMPEDGLDSAVFVAPLHARITGTRHTVRDERIQATLTKLEDMFAADYPINHNRAPGAGIAMGRYRGDKYFSGGAYYFMTLGAAEFYYELAKDVQKNGPLPRTAVNAPFYDRIFGPGEDQARALIAKGDKVMTTVRQYTPADGALSEQFDKVTGAQTSARHLTWSYACFITAATARKEALALLQAPPAPKPPSP